MFVKLFCWKFLPHCSPRSFLILAFILAFLIVTSNILSIHLEQQPFAEVSSLIGTNPPVVVTNEGAGKERYSVVERSNSYAAVEARRRITLMLNSKPVKKNSDSLLGEEFDPADYIGNNNSVAINNNSDPMLQHHFNVVASDSIGFDRILWDVRDPIGSAGTVPTRETIACPVYREVPLSMCKKKNTDHLMMEGVVSVTVIICFHNEARSALLRTVYSVLDKTPRTLLREILLIDDFSNNIEDGQLLQLIPNVKVIRLSKRQGLVGARLVGVNEAKGTMLAFLDSHCEVIIGWLEPLVARVLQFRNHIVSPVIDIINKNNMKFITANVNTKGGFAHNLYFKWLKLNGIEMEQRRKDVTSAIATPSIAGGLFVVEKKFFMEIGSYDEEMEIWGGENVELSLRVWMCGGKLEIIPCSHVGHIFRSSMPYGFGKGRNYFNTVLKNLRRTAEVWMDSDKHFFYSEFPEAKNVDHGNLATRLDLKKELKCKSFQWYINNIFPEFRLNYTDIKYYQFIQWGVGCITTIDDNTVVTKSCELPVVGPSSNQVWEFSPNGQIKHNKMCLTGVQKTDRVITQYCINEGREYDNQLFTMISGKYENSIQIKHNLSQLCLAVRKDTKHLYYQNCTIDETWLANKIT